MIQWDIQLDDQWGFKGVRYVLILVLWIILNGRILRAEVLNLLDKLVEWFQLYKRQADAIIIITCAFPPHDYVPYWDAAMSLVRFFQESCYGFYGVFTPLWLF